jgi:hypothetical protein
MPRRTHVEDYVHIEAPDDIDHVVKDKREAQRAGRPKRHRRQRHYVKTLLRHLAQDGDLED